MSVDILNPQILTINEIDLDLTSPEQECGIRRMIFSSTFYKTEQHMPPAKSWLFLKENGHGLQTGRSWALSP